MIALDDDVVVWHDAECGGYTADLALWRRLAAEAAGPVLDIGAGTGRVALDLAAAGHDVVALDVEPALLEVLAERARAAGIAVATVAADAARFALERRDFALAIVPMQTVQLLSAAGRAGMLTSVRRHLVPAGRLAIALTTGIQPFAPGPDELLPDPDVIERDGWTFVSQPVAVRCLEGGVLLERVREAVAPDGARTRRRDQIELADVDAEALVTEGRAAGWSLEVVGEIPETDRHVGSQVVVLRA